jgi:hypothetical protein
MKARWCEVTIIDGKPVAFGNCDEKWGQPVQMPDGTYKDCLCTDEPLESYCHNQVSVPDVPAPAPPTPAPTPEPVPQPPTPDQLMTEFLGYVEAIIQMYKDSIQG